MHTPNYDWKRFWIPRDGRLNLHDGGYLVDPDGPFGRHLDPQLRTFEDIADIPCLALLGEPGIGKTTTMRAEWKNVDARVRAGGGETLWLDLNAYGNEVLLVEELFGSEEFAHWRRIGDHRLHIFLDSLDECRLRIENVATLLVKKLEDCPVERLSLRLGCRTADWPRTLERGFRQLWGEEAFGAYELAPLRRVDVITAADANGMQPDAFLRTIDEVEAVPLAIKPVTLEFLLESYGPSGQLQSRQTNLYLDGCRRLCEERNESRVDAGRTGELSTNQRLAVAARIAAVTMFSNKGAIWTGLERANLEDDDVLVREVAGRTESVDGEEFPVGEAAVKETLGTGLFSARGPERLSWAHQTYAEFLAAHYLMRRGVETEQAMSLIVHPDDAHGRLTPQLHETAAWLASMSPEVFRKIIDADPVVLLRSDVASTDLEDKVKLVDTMLRLYDEEKLLDVTLVSHSQYRKLEHPSLAEQLRPYITDADKGFVVRRVALDIAEGCSLRSLQEEAADIALDASQSFLVRKEAARFVVHVGDGPTRSRLKPLATGKAGEDPDDDLKGWGLDAVWPEYMSADELFELLSWPNENYRGSYVRFLNHRLPERLTPADLPAALAWVEEQQRRHAMSFWLRKLMDQIMSLGWEHLDAPKVRKAFAKAALARLRQHDEIVEEKSSAFAVAEEPSFRDRVASDDEKRRRLVEEMLELIEKENDTLVLVYSRTPLVLKKDVPWLIERLEAATSYVRRAALATLIGRAFDLWDDEQHELVHKACRRNAVLANEVGRFFDPVELSSELAEEQRRNHQEIESWQQRSEEHPSPDPPLRERVARALEDLKASNVDAFWHLNYFMMFDEQGFAKVSEAEWDVTSMPGWEAADGATRERIVSAAERYVREGDPRTEDWLGKQKPQRPALAGYRALRLLMSRAPDVVSRIPGDVWERWIPAILDYPVTMGTGEEEPHLDLVAAAYCCSPDEVIRTTLLLIDLENEEHSHVFVTRELERCWDDRLAHALLEKARDANLKPQCMGTLLDDLLDYGLHEAKDFAESLIAPLPEGDKDAKLRAVVAARALVFHANDAGWPMVWPAIQRDPEFGGALVDSIANEAHHSGRPQKRLSERQVADLYIWLVQRYPHSEYNLRFRQEGLTSIGHVESIAMWRDDLPKELQGRGTVEACRQIERIAAEFPELEFLKWTLYQARAEMRRRTWTAPEPQQVLYITAGRAKGPTS